MNKEDTLASFFVNIEIIKDDLLAIDEIFPDKELMITALLGFPPTWGAFAARLNSWKEGPTFEDLWTSCNQEELRISLVFDSKYVSNAYISQHKGNKSKGPMKKVDMSKVEWYQCHKKGNYRSDCPENPRNKKRERYQASVFEK